MKLRPLILIITFPILLLLATLFIYALYFERNISLIPRYPQQSVISEYQEEVNDIVTKKVLIFQTSNTPEDVQQFYEKELMEQGWEHQTELRFQKVVQRGFIRNIMSPYKEDLYTIAINIQEKTSVTTVELTLTQFSVNLDSEDQNRPSLSP